MLNEALVLRGGPLFPASWDTIAPAANVKGWCWESHRPGGAVNTEVTAGLLDGMREAKIQGVKQGYTVRLMIEPNWWGRNADDTYRISAKDLAQKLSDRVKATGNDADLVAKTPSKQCSLMMDIERHDAPYVIAALREIRRLRPGRSVIWTMEPNQGGWIAQNPELVGLINNDPFISVAVQTYDFNMNPYGSVDEMRVNLWQAGLKRDKVEVFYCAKNRPNAARWSGILYDWANFFK